MFFFLRHSIQWKWKKGGQMHNPETRTDYWKKCTNEQHKHEQVILLQIYEVTLHDEINAECRKPSTSTGKTKQTKRKAWTIPADQKWVRANIVSIGNSIHVHCPSCTSNVGAFRCRKINHWKSMPNSLCSDARLITLIHRFTCFHERHYMKNWHKCHLKHISISAYQWIKRCFAK